MSCDELRDAYELYAMGVLEDPERAAIGEHLDRGCEVCMAEIKRAREMMVLLSGTSTPAEPSARLRGRILASVGVEAPRRFGLAPWFGAVAALCFLAAFYFAGRERNYIGELARTRARMREQNIELTRMQSAFAILNGRDTTEAGFGANQPKGKVWVSPSAGVLLIASNLPPAPAGKVYEMWVIPKAGNPIPAGLFQSESGGAAMHLQPGPIDVAATGAVAVTLENEAGAPQPTSTPLIIAALNAPSAGQ